MIHPPHRNVFSGGPILTGRRFPLWWGLLALLIAVLLFSGVIDEDPLRLPRPRRDPRHRATSRHPHHGRFWLHHEHGPPQSTLRRSRSNDRVPPRTQPPKPSRRRPDRLLRRQRLGRSANANLLGDTVLTEPQAVASGTSIPAGICEANRIAAQPFDGKTIAVLFTDGQADAGQIATVANHIDRLPTGLMHLVGKTCRPDSLPMRQVSTRDGAASIRLWPLQATRVCLVHASCIPEAEC